MKLLMLLAFLFGSTSLVGKEVELITFKIQKMIESPTKGKFIEAIRKSFDKAGLKVNITIKTPQEAVKGFMDGKYNVIYPALDINFPANAPVVKTEPIIYKYDFVFTKKGSTPLASISDLKGKKIGLTSGYPYIKELTDDPKISVVDEKSEAKNVRNLMTGRIDAFIGEEETAQNAFKRLKSEELYNYDQNKPVSKQPVFFAFQKDDEIMANKVSQAIKELRKDDYFQGLFGKYSK